MIRTRQGHASVRLKDGRVLIFGGTYFNAPNMDTEIFDPSLNQFFKGSHLAIECKQPGGVALLDGNVFIYNVAPFCSQLFDVATNSFIALDSLGLSSDHPIPSVTPLSDGSLLIIFGELACAYLYHPDSRSFQYVGKTNCPRGWHKTILLKDGRVWVFGGVNPNALGPSFPPFSQAEFYSPNDNSFYVDNNYTNLSVGAAVVLLDNGSILVTGGMSIIGGMFFASAEIYQPNSSTPVVYIGSMNVARAMHGAKLLKDGRVIIYGGYTREAGDQTGVVEIFQM